MSPHTDRPDTEPATGEPVVSLTDAEAALWDSFRTSGRLVLDRLDRQLRGDSGMPHSYYEILVRLSEAPARRLRMNQLANQTLASPSRLSHAVTQLEESGWVRRTSCPADRRGQHVELTGDGAEALADAASGHVAMVRSVLFDVLTAEQLAGLRDASDAIVAHAGPLPGPDRRRGR